MSSQITDNSMALGQNARQQVHHATEAAEKIVALTPVQQMISSCSGAFLTSMLMTPFDVVKTRLQAQEHSITASIAGEDCKYVVFRNGLMEQYVERCTVCGNTPGSTTLEACAARPVRLNGTWDAMVKISESEGITALWRGLPPTLVMAVPATVIYFTGYEQLKALYERRSVSQSYAPLLAGASARVFSATFVSPLELIRTKMQAARNHGFRKVFTIVKQQAHDAGITSLWRGLTPTLLRDVPFSAMYFSGYEYLKPRFRSSLQQRFGGDHLFLSAFLSGATSGAFSAFVTTPFDVIKTKMQADQITGPYEPNARIKPAMEVTRDIYRHQGIRGFFVGLSPRLAKVAPACAIMISSYETTKKIFRDYNHQEAIA
eukprot:Clim_evm3s54 gene=Clim_evmTU3s54